LVAFSFCESKFTPKWAESGFVHKIIIAFVSNSQGNKTDLLFESDGAETLFLGMLGVSGISCLFVLWNVYICTTKQIISSL